MGMWVTFECAHCQYRAQVSGCDDSGMLADSTTIICVQCREICDVVTHSRETNRHKKIRARRTRSTRSGGGRRLASALAATSPG